jgi:hypothetical protein
MQLVSALADVRADWDLGSVGAVAEVGTSRTNVLRLEHEESVYVSTLRHGVEALGGELEISAVFPDGKVTLTTKGP